MLGIASGLQLAGAPFELLRGVDSDSDEFPVGSVRDMWSVEALKRQDREREAYESRVRDDVMAACRAIIEAVDLKARSAATPPRG
jgi:hypothetical protein